MIYRINQYVKPKRDSNLIWSPIKYMKNFWISYKGEIIILSVLYKKNVESYFGSTLDSNPKIECTYAGDCVVTQDGWTNPQHLECDKYRCEVAK